MSKLNTLTQELATIKLAQEELSNKEEVIKAALLLEMKKENLTKVPNEYGTVSIGARSTYKFTDAVSKLQHKVDIKKDEEIKKGLATVTTKEYVSFRIKTSA